MSCLINKLPLDITQKIFDDHFKYFLKYNILKKALNSKKSYCLNTEDIIHHINEILFDNKYINFLRKENSIFNTIYYSHFIDNEVGFVNLPKNHSMALSWLMYLYH
tara:strand:+ start:1906 stop:2223 length:318 start_codon:yes stop_codon:yes gene_type:complete